ncbi:MAG: hypothetical protein GXY83_07800 [Rhodopirellula sp.]|nr:hypothetical protein [Rhodopirellula sp.]
MYLRFFMVLLAALVIPAEGAELSREPRELLNLYGIDDSQLAGLADRQPWQADEDEILMRILYRLPSVRSQDFQRWAQPLDSRVLFEDPSSHRGLVYRLQGHAVSVEALELQPEMTQRLGLERYYRVEIELDNGGRAAIFARDVPEAWTKIADLSEPAAAIGFFLKIGQQPDGEPMPILVAPRIQWFPPSLLGRLGMDVGLLDDIRRQQIAQSPQGTASGIDIRKLRLTGKDREAFYQMLAAVGRAEPGLLLRESRKRLAASGRDSFSVVPLFNQPHEQVGELVALSGTARRIIPITVDDEEIRQRLGIQQYYEIYLFTDDSQGNPLVFCVRDLPPGMPIGEGARFGENTVIAGFFFKTWAYRRTSQDTPTEAQWQLAPLLIGCEPVWNPAPPPPANTMMEVIAGGVFVLVLAGLFALVWAYGRSDRRARRFTIGRNPP